MDDRPGSIGTIRRWIPRSWGRQTGLIIGPALCTLMILNDPPPDMGMAAWRVAAVASWMAVWWLTEAVPVAITALLPLALFPILGILSIRNAASPFANPLIFLFLGGFSMALALERWNLHRRLALHIVRLVGTGQRRIVGGIMVAAAFLSMWISNTATAAMMLPVALSLVDRTDDTVRDRFTLALLLGIAYGASIGGLGTLIGTPPNALLAAYMMESRGIEIGFGRWMLIGLPVVAVFLPLCWLLLTRFIAPLPACPTEPNQDEFPRDVDKPGRFGVNEARVATVFVFVVLLWISRPLLSGFVPGVSDAGIAVLGAVLMFTLPAHGETGGRLLDAAAFARLPWPILILFGGGLSLGTAIDSSGLATWIGDAMSGLGSFPAYLTLAVVIAVVVFLTELTSNTATAATFIPVAAALAVGMTRDPLFLALPVALAASCAFMMPVATPPNAIVFGSGRLTVGQMAGAGIWLNLVSIALLLGVSYALFAFGIAQIVF